MMSNLIALSPLYDMLEEYVQEKVDAVLRDSPEVIAAILEGRCYRALCKIQGFIQAEGMNDFECVEHIVEVFCEYGLDCGTRHDFG